MKEVQSPLTVALLGLLLGVGSPLDAALPVTEVALANGFQVLVVRRPDLPMVAAAWAVRAGSAEDPPGATGVAHLLEHALFHGTRTVASGSEFARLYAENGAVGINAYTEEDFTVFAAMVPRERLELWFWLESDRLREPVFRDLERELRVVAEERRQRVATTPTGPLDERVSAAFWGEDPYGRPVSGLPEDLARLGGAAAETFFARHYRAGNVVAALVGDVDEASVRELAGRYFGRLVNPGPHPWPVSENPHPWPLSRSAGEGDAAAEKRLVSGSAGEGDAVSENPHPWPLSRSAGEGDGAAEKRLVSGSAGEGDAAEKNSFPKPLELECDCAPQARVLWRTVPFGHADAAALDVLAGVLNGRSGRLHRALVLGQGVAFAAWAEHAPLRRAGSFELRAETREDSAPEVLAAALRAEAERLRREPVAAAELAKVKHQIVADSYRKLRDPMGLALRLVAYAAVGDWRHVESWADRASAVSAEDVQRVATRYLGGDTSLTALYRRRGPRPGAKR